MVKVIKFHDRQKIGQGRRISHLGNNTEMLGNQLLYAPQLTTRRVFKHANTRRKTSFEFHTEMYYKMVQL